MMHMRYVLALVFVAMLAGCTGLDQVVRNTPAAQTPTGAVLSAILTPGGGWTTVGPAANGEFEVLPGGLPSGGFQLFFRAPYPADLHVLLDGQDIPKFDRLPAGSDPLATGFYRTVDINANQTPAQWRISIRPPSASLGTARHVLELRMVSVNPNFPVGHPSHESPSLTLVLMPQRTYMLSVATTGSGRGLVRSGAVAGSAATVDCGSACVTDFGQSVTVDLRATPLDGGQFAGWSGACSGSGVCSVTLNGTAASVVANFSRPTGSAPMACPAPAEVSGYTFAQQPDCATGIRDAHPTASLACDSQGFFCCESVPGASNARCGGAGKSEFMPDCRFLGNLALLVQPYGCYVRDRSP